MVFLDTNILLELLLPGRKYADHVEELLSGISERTVISMLSVHIVYYFGRLSGVDDTLIAQALSKHDIFDLSVEDYVWALQHEEGGDFEDALQVSIALRAGCDRFVTLDQKLIKYYTSQTLSFVQASHE